MLVLALDTSSAACAVALVEYVGSCERPLAQRSVVDARRHGELLAPLLAEVLAAAGRTIRDVEAVAVGAGPGPFTGLRVGVVTATVLAQALDVPVRGVCSLDAIGAGLPGRVAVAADARRREVYWAVYADGTRVAGPAVGRPQVLVELSVDRVVGAGAALHAHALRGLADPAGPQYPPTVVLARLAFGLGAPAGAVGSDPPVPLYLRRPDAVLPVPAKRVTA
ncbi:MAG: tRNA (adenosine(37)-N6)-threonylcarbamoyltransferase complex dimerization subunit type 1 TsaB [Frankiaceae bacterium]